MSLWGGQSVEEFTPGVLYGIIALLLRGSEPGLVRPAAGTDPGSPGPCLAGRIFRPFYGGAKGRVSHRLLFPAVRLSPPTRERLLPDLPLADPFLAFPRFVHE
jgi:hypothetical protein